MVLFLWLSQSLLLAGAQTLTCDSLNAGKCGEVRGACGTDVAC